MMLQACVRRSYAFELPLSLSPLSFVTTSSLAIIDRPRRPRQPTNTAQERGLRSSSSSRSSSIYHYGCCGRRRFIHSTRKQEILPLIGLATVAVMGRYSWRAMQRMNTEWEDYQWELQHYEKHLARQGNVAGTVLAVDLGSLFMKICANQTVIVSREGDRALFNGLWFDESNDSEREASILRSRQALEKFFYARPSGDECTVQLPWQALNSNNSDTANKIVLTSVSPAVKEALDQRHDEKLVRMVVTAPLESLGVYTKAFENVALGYHSERPPVVLPEPVAAIWGAQTKGLLPDDDGSSGGGGVVAPKSTLVIDVGALVSQISAVQRDIVIASVAIPWGGENLVRLAVELLLKDSPVQLQDARSLSALHVHARAAVVELSTKTRVMVHVPYLFPDPGNHHLDTTLSRSVLEQALNDDIRNGLFEKDETTSRQAFSPHLPPPVDLASMWVSSVTQVLEQSRLMPSNIDHVLVVGGGSKPQSVLQSLQTALFSLMGSESTSKRVVPDPSLQSELTVIGASTMLPSFEYSIEHGLKRIRD